MKYNKQYWTIGAGGNGKKFIANKIIAVDYGVNKNLSRMSKEDLQIEFGRNDIKAVEFNKFINEIQIGDIVILKQGRHQILAIGEVTSDYFLDDSFDQVREVNWLKSESIEFSGNIPTNGTVFMANKELIKFVESTLFESNNEFIKKRSRYTDVLKSSKNIILRGAPGTGKTYLARQIARELTGGNEEQIDFVQFHPSYDYTDFVEGLRPLPSDDEQISFGLQDGIFKKFCQKANEAQKTGGQDNFDEAWNAYLEYVNNRDEKERLTDFSYLTVNSRNNFNVNYESKSQGTVLTKSYVYELYKDENYLKQTYYRSQGKKVLETLRKKFGLKDYISPTEIDTDKNFVFIIDEINRGEISKIFGELFFSIDPGYRGKDGEVSTQYANLHETNEKFYIPENVYIIGTMNDIDRSVDTFDFAMRRRFRFVEITAESQLGMLDKLLGDGAEEAKIRLRNLNAAIEKVEELNSHYHVGPSYFLKLQEVDFDYELLWSDYIKPLLEDYLRGSYEEVETLETLKKAFDKTSNERTKQSITGDNESDGNDDTDNR
ncbi:AAA family ATPase [Streptococcus sanguinis]|uniref:AAA family ATPase n=1 Tax=Streptococcus sanguinis TaxID=1305 RepID=UPI000F67BB84|nr:AAA family ATPase [Streptococcus sanguinis]RSI25110.1 5-methylcytosine-specific restriction enzyme B [Streptococcus sanguinis]